MKNNKTAIIKHTLAKMMEYIQDNQLSSVHGITASKYIKMVALYESKQVQAHELLLYLEHYFGALEYVCRKDQIGEIYSYCKERVSEDKQYLAEVNHYVGLNLNFLEDTLIVGNRELQAATRLQDILSRVVTLQKKRQWFTTHYTKMVKSMLQLKDFKVIKMAYTPNLKAGVLQYYGRNKSSMQVDELV